ncbi:hypothetical protein PENTCL1PPCAC_12970, partial [Pristionchus entomophagus]
LILNLFPLQTCEFAIQSDDTFVSVISKGFDVMSAIHRNSNHPNIQRTLEALDIELSLYMRSENIKGTSIQSLMYGIIQSLQLTLLHLSTATQIPRCSPLFPVEPKEEPIDVSETTPSDNQL